MTSPFVGEIRAFAFDFPPNGWAFCDGRILPIASYSSLFSVISATYGGDGKTTFALPDMRGRAPIHFGNGPGLSQYNLGEAAGAETIALQTTHLPAHNHVVAMSAGAVPPDLLTLPVAGAYAQQLWDINSQQTLPAFHAPPAGAAVNMSSQALGMTGGGQPHENRQPYLALNFCISLQGRVPYPPAR